MNTLPDMNCTVQYELYVALLLKMIDPQRPGKGLKVKAALE